MVELNFTTKLQNNSSWILDVCWNYYLIIILSSRVVKSFNFNSYKTSIYMSLLTNERQRAL